MCSDAPAPLTSSVHASRSNGCPSRSSPEIRTETAMWIRSDFRWDCQFIVAVNTVATPPEAVKNHVGRVVGQIDFSRIDSGFHIPVAALRLCVVPLRLCEKLNVQVGPFHSQFLAEAQREDAKSQEEHLHRK